ncbi:MAG: group II truncated hemoglobin [Gallionellaceae bacterium]|nr:group II truncated hemoglobin [Gallionellaceae bacterium]
MQISTDTRSHYERIGGETRVRALVQRFYQLMDELPEAHGVRKMHGADLKKSEDKLFMFLSGWMNGPQLFIEKFGHPRLRQRHISFSIGDAERDQWMMCMSQALRDVVEDEDLRTELIAAFGKVADFMRNQP